MGEAGVNADLLLTQLASNYVIIKMFKIIILVYSNFQSVTKTPVTPGGLSTALPRSCLIFQSTVRMQENHDIFREKLSVTVSLQRPRRCHRALMAFYPVPTVFMVEPCFHGVATALTSC